MLIEVYIDAMLCAINQNIIKLYRPPNSTVEVSNRTGIYNKNVAVLSCPSDTRILCACKVKYISYNVPVSYAEVFYFIGGSNKVNC